MTGAILFDLDGTLTDTLADIADAMNRALRMHGLPEHPVDAYRMMVGNGAAMLARRAVGERQELAADVLRDYQRRYETHSLVRTRPYEGMPEALRALKARGLRLAVLSNKPDADSRLVVSHFFGGALFDIVQGQKPGVPAKPDPTAALAIAEALGVPPAEWLYLGDSGVDMDCAVRAGMRPAGVLWGFRGEEELLAHGAACLISHPSRIVDIVEANV